MDHYPVHESMAETISKVGHMTKVAIVNIDCGLHLDSNNAAIGRF